MPLSLPSTSYTMPLRSKKSRVAKQKRSHGRAAFRKCAASPPPSPGGSEGSDYRAPDNSTDASSTEAGSSNESGTNDQAATPVEGLQRLYSVFLPPHLRPKERIQEKRQKISNRRAVYTGDSRTTNWRKDTDLKNAAKGCKTLDGYVLKGVSSFNNHSGKSTLSQSEAAA